MFKFIKRLFYRIGRKEDLSELAEKILNLGDKA